MQERRAALTGLIRKYGGLVPATAGRTAPTAVPDLAAVLAWAKQAGSRLTELDGDDDRLAEPRRRGGSGSAASRRRAGRRS